MFILYFHNVCICCQLVLHSLLCTVIPYTCTAEECSALAPIPNGVITYGPDMIADYDVGTVATHTCNEGFILSVGSPARVCLVSRRWSGFTPVCGRIGKIYRYRL